MLVFAGSIESAAKARALSQCIGAGAAVVVSVLIVPWFARKEADRTLQDFRAHCKRALAHIEDLETKSICYSNIAFYYAKNAEFDAALTNAQKAIELLVNFDPKTNFENPTLDNIDALSLSDIESPTNLNDSIYGDLNSTVISNTQDCEESKLREKSHEAVHLDSSIENVDMSAYSIEKSHSTVQVDMEQKRTPDAETKNDETKMAETEKAENENAETENTKIENAGTEQSKRSRAAIEAWSKLIVPNLKTMEDSDINKEADNIYYYEPNESNDDIPGDNESEGLMALQLEKVQASMTSQSVNQRDSYTSQLGSQKASVTSQSVNQRDLNTSQSDSQKASMTSQSETQDKSNEALKEREALRSAPSALAESSERQVNEAKCLATTTDSNRKEDHQTGVLISEESQMETDQAGRSETLGSYDYYV